MAHKKVLPNIKSRPHYSLFSNNIGFNFLVKGEIVWTRNSGIKGINISRKSNGVQVESLILLCANDKFGFMDLSGKVVVEPLFDYWILHTSDFNADGTAIITRVDKNNPAVSLSGVINAKGDLIIPFKYQGLSASTMGLRVAAISEWGESTLNGIIDAEGNWVVTPKCFEMGPIQDGFVTASVIKDGRQHTGLLKVDGTWLYEPKNYGVFSFKKNMVVFIEDTGHDGVGVVMSLYDLEGNQLLEGRKYNYIEILSKDYIRCGTVIDNRKPVMHWTIFNTKGIELMPDSNIRTAELQEDGNIITTVLKEDAFYKGLLKGASKQWLICPKYYEIIKYTKGIGAGIYKIDDKSTEDSIVFTIELFDSSGNVIYTTAEIIMSSSNFRDIHLNQHR